ncbi:MAG: type VI secretion system contractile sheath large subunit [Acidobacteriota bacterium]|nr:type VI secretion system contractile sheath large subunit [Acidobacteriota bacterium]
MTIRPNTKGARVVTDAVFHMAIVGNFSGRDHDFEDPGPLALSTNSWDELFERIAPSVQIISSLPRVEDQKIDISFSNLRDFREKGLTARVPLLAGMAALAKAIEDAPADSAPDIAALLAEHPALAVVRELANSGGEAQVLDLLSMVDIGEEDEMSLPTLKTLFSGGAVKQSKAMTELNRVRNSIREQIFKNANFTRLMGLWRGLRLFLPLLRKKDDGPRLNLTLIDCPKDQICDAVYLTFIRPESGEPQPLDLLVCTEPLGVNQDDRHILHHLGRMAEGLSTPFLLESGPALFGCRTWGLLRHVPDISGKLNGPDHIKWRKQREEPGSEWLFLCAGPFRVREESAEDEDTEPAAPASFLPLMMMMEKLQNGLWPSEMMGAWGRYEAPGAPLAQLNEEQLNDMAFEGIIGIGASESGEFLELGGITCYGTIKLPARDQANPANILEYTLPYRFYSGCCSRFLAKPHEDHVAALRDFTAVKKEEDLTYEEADGQHIFRIKPPFTILGAQPDLILAFE